jgi:hypothetical protein
MQWVEYSLMKAMLTGNEINWRKQAKGDFSALSSTTNVSPRNNLYNVVIYKILDISYLATAEITP